jgi:hypothetical protein
VCPALHIEDHVVRPDLRDAALEQQLDRAPLDRGDVLRPGARELSSAVAQRHGCARVVQRHRGLHGAVAAAHDQDAAAAKAGRVVQPVGDLRQILTGHVEAAVAAALAQRDDDVARAERRRPPRRRNGGGGIVGQQDLVPRGGAPQALGRHPEGERKVHVAHLCPQLLEQVLLRRRCHLQRTARLHREREGEDGLRFREVDDRRERLGALEHEKPQSLAVRLERGGHAGHARAQDHQVERGLAGGSGRGDPLHGRGPGVARELEQGHAGQVTDHIHARQGGRAVRADDRPALDPARRHVEMEPTGVAAEHVLSPRPSARARSRGSPP